MQNDVKQVDRDAMVRFSRLQCPSVFAAHRIAAESKTAELSIATIDRQADEIDAKDKRIAELEGERDAIHEAAGNVYKYHMATQGEWPDALEDVLSPLWVLLVQRENAKEPTQ